MRPKHSARCASSINGSSEFLACGEHRRSIVALAFGRRVSKPYQTLQAASQPNWKILAKGFSRRPSSCWWAKTINLR